VNRELGVSSLAMVLMLLVLGSLMLQGLNQAQRQQTQKVSNESRLIQRTAKVHSALQWGKVHSALQWGKVQRWAAEAGAQCLVYESDSRVCLRRFSDGTLLLIAKNGALSLWQSGSWAGGNLHFSPHGWSDFCPLKEASLCQIP